MPLAYAPGHVECGFGEDLVIIDGVEWNNGSVHLLKVYTTRRDSCLQLRWTRKTGQLVKWESCS